MFLSCFFAAAEAIWCCDKLGDLRNKQRSKKLRVESPERTPKPDIKKIT
jgi:hypothetical protein